MNMGKNTKGEGGGSLSEWRLEGRERGGRGISGGLVGEVIWREVAGC